MTTQETPHPATNNWLQRGLAVSVVVVGLGALEFWSVLQLSEHHWGGPLAGVAATLALLVCQRQLGSQLAGSAALMSAVAVSMVELALGVALITSFTAIMLVLFPSTGLFALFQQDESTEFVVYAIALTAVLVGARGWFKYSRRLVEEANSVAQASDARARLAEKQKELVNAELRLLRAQIEPHFLWNTLAQLQYLIKKNPEAAERMSEHLIRFLMHVLTQSKQDQVTLQDEFDSIQAYLAIMKIRMGDRLSVQVTIDAGLARVPFPSLILQTLVENAIKHGIEPKVGPVTVAVRAYMQTDGSQYVVLEVEDDGAGLRPGTTPGTGLGLSNVRERLNAHYGSAAALSIGSRDAGGVIARIQFPLDTAGTSYATANA